MWFGLDCRVSSISRGKFQILSVENSVEVSFPVLFSALETGNEVPCLEVTPLAASLEDASNAVLKEYVPHTLQCLFLDNKYILD